MKKTLTSDKHTSEMERKLADFTPAPTERKVVNKPETFRDVITKNKKSGIAGKASKAWKDAVTEEVEYEPLVGYTCEVCEKVKYVDNAAHIPTLRVCDECKASLRAKLSA